MNEESMDKILKVLKELEDKVSKDYTEIFDSLEKMIKKQKEHTKMMNEILTNLAEST